MKTKLFDHLAVGTIAATTLLTAVLYARLPAQVPTHFNVHGVADGWMPRAVGAWLLPATAFTMWLLVRFGATLLPALWRARMQASPMSLVGALLALLFSLIQCVVLYAALHSGESVGGALGLALGAVWLCLGLVMPRIRRNPWVGVRTAWTLSSDENWARTHRFAGYTFVAAGVVAVLAVPIGLPRLAPFAIVASAVLSSVYSFVLARRLPPTT